MPRKKTRNVHHPFEADLSPPDTYTSAKCPEGTWRRILRDVKKYKKLGHRYKTEFMCDHLFLQWQIKDEGLKVCHMCKGGNIDEKHEALVRQKDHLFECCAEGCDRLTHHRWKCSSGPIDQRAVPADPSCEAKWYCWECHFKMTVPQAEKVEENMRKAIQAYDLAQRIERLEAVKMRKKHHEFNSSSEQASTIEHSSTLHNTPDTCWSCGEGPAADKLMTNCSSDGCPKKTHVAFKCSQLKKTPGFRSIKWYCHDHKTKDGAGDDSRRAIREAQSQTTGSLSGLQHTLDKERQSGRRHSRVESTPHAMPNISEQHRCWACKNTEILGTHFLKLCSYQPPLGEKHSCTKWTHKDEACSKVKGGVPSHQAWLCPDHRTAIASSQATKGEKLAAREDVDEEESAEDKHGKASRLLKKRKMSEHTTKDASPVGNAKRTRSIASKEGSLMETPTRAAGKK